MNPVSIVLDVDKEPPFPGMAPGVELTQDIKFSRVPKGSEDGKSMVYITALSPKGVPALIQVPMRTFLAAAEAFKISENDTEDIRIVLNRAINGQSAKDLPQPPPDPESPVKRKPGRPRKVLVEPSAPG